MAKEKILVVDDEEDILELVEYNLTKNGYGAICVATGGTLSTRPGRSCPTRAPKGETPIQRQWERHDRLSVISAITVAPRRRRLALYSRIEDQQHLRGGCGEAPGVSPKESAAQPRQGVARPMERP
jgi:CheY-like chemotaxis protein